MKKARSSVIEIISIQGTIGGMDGRKQIYQVKEKERVIQVFKQMFHDGSAEIFQVVVERRLRE